MIKEPSSGAVDDFNKLPLSQISFSADCKADKSREQSTEYLNSMVMKWSYDYSLTSPFAALSGLQDENLLWAESELYLNTFSKLHIDAKVLPLFKQSGRLSNYALEFYRAGSLSNFLKDFKETGMHSGDLINSLKDFKIIIRRICNAIDRIAPTYDAVRRAFHVICENFERQFDFLVDELVRAD